MVQIESIFFLCVETIMEFFDSQITNLVWCSSRFVFFFVHTTNKYDIVGTGFESIRLDEYFTLEIVALNKKILLIYMY